MQYEHHHVPGRLRMRIPDLKMRPALAAQLAESVRGLPGIHAVETNSFTGGLLIHYDRDCASSRAFWRDMHAALALGLPGRQAQVHDGCPRFAGKPTAVDKIADKAIGLFVEKLAERSALTLLGALL